MRQAPVEALAALPKASVARTPAAVKAAIAAFVASLFLPTIYTLGSINLSPTLLLLILGFPPLLGMWAAGRAGPRMAIDMLVLAFAFWAAGTRLTLLDFNEALEPGGVVLLQSAGGYLAGRVLVRDAATTRLAFGAAIAGIALMIPFLLWESVTGTKPLLELAGLFGKTLAPTQMDPRWGFRRAQGMFEHPILLGIFCATLVSATLFMFPGGRMRAMRWLGAPLVVLAAMTSFSTGALLSMNTQFGLIAWNAALRRVASRWTILIWLVVALYVTADLLSNRTPFHLFVDYATFNSQSSYNRILIWQFGSAAVMESPLLGHGTDDWERPSYMSSSMDNFWLVIAYRYGLIGFGLLAAAFVLTIIRIGRHHGADADINAMRRGAIFALVATMIAIVSVHLWNNSYIWLMFMLGAVAWMTVPDRMAPPGGDSTHPSEVAPENKGPRHVRLRRLGF
ncbi:O-antigen ligase family protein [Sphingomonas jeddahensis]|uniref:O-antigen ligase-related domain-containing protein n=1 Tax=Sphingomonas jeddahensis TaxID=1915074 RepID=A0A1V2EU56_9SPHN|nr:hypothetical protein [Sphingomonas jeddahensis]ONF96201.1 hypothetical protein SPHI_14300 [Sphingomonas jeddahensis]